MRIVQLSESLSVSDQVAVSDVPAIAAAGFRVLINNRPDHEVVHQPTSEELGAAARAAGLQYYHFPVTARDFPGPDIGEMAALIDNPAAPALAFCRTGTRCTNLWVWSRAETDRERAVERARQCGFDLSLAGIRP